MTNLEYITNELKNEMKMHVDSIQQFNTWISILKPLNLYENTLYLEVPKKDTLFIFDKIWVPQLQSALDNIKDRIGGSYKVRVTAKDAKEYNNILTLGKDYDSNGQMRINQVSSHPRPQLEPENIFDNFIEGKSNQYA